MLRSRLTSAYSASRLGDTTERLQTAIDQSQLVAWFTRETEPKSATIDLKGTAVGKPGIYLITIAGTLLRQSWTQSTVQRIATTVRSVLFRSPRTSIVVGLLAVLVIGLVSSF